MVKEGEYNRKYAKELSRLILENPQLRVVMWINSDGISDEYASWCGDLGKPEIKEITIDANQPGSCAWRSTAHIIQPNAGRPATAL